MESTELFNWLENSCSEEISKEWKVLLSRLEALTDNDVMEVRVRAVCCLLKMLVPVIEDKSVFAEICEKVNKVLLICAESVSTELSNPEDSWKDDLSRVATFIEFIPEILSAISSSPRVLQMALTSVTISLSLCNQVENNHRQVFELLSSQLGALFKSAYTLLKVSLEHVGSLVAGFEYNELILSALRTVATVAINFDPSVLVLCWKGVGKLLILVKDNYPDVTSVIKELCVAIEIKSSDCFQSAPAVNSHVVHPLFQKLVKVCRFLGAMLVKLTLECKAHSHTDVVLQLLLNVHGKVESSLTSLQAMSDITDNVLLMTEPLLSLLVHDELFFHSILSPPLHDRRAYGRLICLCGVIKIFSQIEEGLQDYCLEPISSLVEATSTCRLFDTMFSSVSQCYLADQREVTLRGVMCNGQPQRMVTLYEYVVTHLCTLTALIPTRHLHTMECCLLRYVLSPWQTFSLLSCDIWTFFARHSSQEVVEGYCHLLAKLLTRIHSFQSVVVGSLLSRFISLLSPASQAALLSQYIESSTCLRIWCHLHTLLPSTDGGLTELVQRISFLSKEEVLSCQNIDIKCASLDCLACVHQQTPQSHALCESVISMTTHSPSQLFNHAIKFLSLQTLSPSQIEKVLCSVIDILNAECEEYIGVSVCALLHDCQQVHGHHEPPMLELVANCFQSLIGHTSWLVCQLALESFRTFAEVTPHVNVIEHCIPLGHTDKVIKFLHKVPCGVLQNEYVEMLLKNQHTVIQSGLGGPSKLVQEWVDFVQSHNSKLSYAETRRMRQLAKDIVQFCDLNDHM